jgi:hypothetical protein
MRVVDYPSIPARSCSATPWSSGAAICRCGRTGKVERSYRERFNPTLEPLLELEVERVLVTHGAPVLEAGTAKLAAALKRNTAHGSTAPRPAIRRRLPDDASDTVGETS